MIFRHTIVKYDILLCFLTARLKYHIYFHFTHKDFVALDLAIFRYQKKIINYFAETWTIFHQFDDFECLFGWGILKWLLFAPKLNEFLIFLRSRFWIKFENINFLCSVFVINSIISNVFWVRYLKMATVCT